MQFAKPGGHLFEYDNKRAEPLARWLFQMANHPVNSVADIGCGTRPMYPWIQKMNEDGNLDYFGVDVDPAAKAKLTEMGLECLHPDEAAKRTAEVVLAYEVIEHIPEADTDEFWGFLKAVTKDILVMTTPNFEGFKNGIYPTEEFAEMRYVPDHFKDWSPTSPDPHAHKVAFTAQSLSDQIRSVFDPKEWDWLVYRAWRWSIIDHSTQTVHQHHFKLHSVVWRKELYRR